MTSELRPKTTTTRFQRSVTPNVRWRSSRRRSSEKSAAQCRREVDGLHALMREMGKIQARRDQIIDAIGRKPPTR